jgi:hypothetical protein
MFNRLKILLLSAELMGSPTAAAARHDAGLITNKQTMPTLLFLLSAACALESLRRIAAYLQ